VWSSDFPPIISPIIVKRRVLIVSPHFPPINAADHQRIRMSLPYFEQFGWEPMVLTVRPDRVVGVLDPLLSQTVPDTVAITQVQAFSTRWTRYLGVGSLGWRCLPFLTATGDRLLATGEFDLVYFSNTVFATMPLGLRWWRRFGVPYVLDFQDPWVNDYYEQAPDRVPPGGWLKYRLNQVLGQRQEPSTVRHARHMICVSPAYPKMLCQRHRDLREDQFTVLPFGAPEADFEILPTLPVRQSIFDPGDGLRHWVYVGRGGEDMAVALRALFLALRTECDRQPDAWADVRLHFVGTSYAPRDRAVKTIEPIAEEFGLGDRVMEHTDRIPYFEALQVLVESDAILMIGSDDPGYTASKLYPCILARKPILAIFHQDSSVVGILQRCGAGWTVPFASTSQPADLLAVMGDRLNQLRGLPKGYQPSTDWSAFQPYTAREMTRRQCTVFDQCL
jgi:hypothetical protein